MKHLIIIILILNFNFIFAYKMKKETINSGGEIGTSASYELNGSVSQMAVGISSNGTHEIRSGFWYSGTTTPEVDSDGDTDGDADNVATDIENAAPNSGDGNNDGVQDGQQANVASLLMSTGRYVTIEAVDCGSLINVNEQRNINLSDWYFPFGVVNFEVPCAAVEIKLYYHGAADLTAYTYRKLRNNNSWFTYSSAQYNTEEINGATVATVTINLIDGQVEDYDGITNGSIIDPGGPAFPISNTSIPSLNWKWSILLVLLILALFYKKRV